ncbi:MAG: hypothetical protein WC444_05315 [Candidatus Paceibacterota bacterium]
MKTNENVIILTKAYIIELFDSMFFSNRINWGGIDLFNTLPIINSEKNGEEGIEQRFAFMVHESAPMALKLLITASVGKEIHKVCYRVKTVNKQIEIDDRKMKIPVAMIDCSIANLSLGFKDPSALIFNINTETSDAAEGSVVWNLMKFITNSYMVSHELDNDDKNLFDEVVLDLKSLPPVPGDEHYRQVYAIS